MNAMMNISLREDVPVAVIRRLLEDAQLPTADIAPGTRQRFIGAQAGGDWFGVAAIEPLGEVALLRSLAVVAAKRSQGLGRALINAAEALAQSLGARVLYLLTTSAAPYFAQSGYTPMARDDAPMAIRTTTQFASLCPATATLMRKELALHP
jgi:amino-acid N-acetyltransferase